MCMRLVICRYCGEHVVPTEGGACPSCRRPVADSTVVEVGEGLSEVSASETARGNERTTRELAVDLASPEDMGEGSMEPADDPLLSGSGEFERVDRSCSAGTRKWPIAIVVVASLSVLVGIWLLRPLCRKGESLYREHEGTRSITAGVATKRFSESVFAFEYPGDWISLNERETKVFIQESESQSRELFKAYSGSAVGSDPLVVYAFGLEAPNESVKCIGVLMRIPPQATDYIDAVYARSLKVFEWGKQQGRIREVISNAKTKIGATPVLRSELTWAGGEHHIVITYHFPEAASYGGTLLIVMEPNVGAKVKQDVSTLVSSLKLSPPGKQPSNGPGMREGVLRAQESWNTTVEKNSVEALFSFVKSFPDDRRIEEARARIEELVITDAYHEQNSHVLGLEQVRAIASSGLCPSGTTDRQRQYLLLTLTAAVRLLPSAMRVTLPEIQPDASGDPLVLVPAEDADTPEECRPPVGTQHSVLLAAVRNVGGLVLPPGTSRLADGFLMTKGDSTATSKTPRRNVRSYLMVRTIPGYSTYVLGTELPKEAVPYSMGGGRGLMGSPDTVVPNGEGCIFRFRGAVKDFFEGWTIQSDGVEPLTFVLLRGDGLTYVFGKGSVIGPGNRRYEFTGLSRVKK